MLSLTDSFTVLRLSENFAPPNLSDYLRASAAASIFFFPASCLAMSLQVQPAGGLNTRVTLCLFGLCASRINPAHFRVLVGLSGLEPPTSRLSGVRSNRLSYKPIFFFCFGGHLLSHTVTSAVPSAAWVLTIVFGMGTGVSPKRIATRNFRFIYRFAPSSAHSALSLINQQ